MAATSVTKPSIVVLGNIGSGKTTLMETLSTALSLPRLAEDTAANPYLPMLRSNPSRWCLHNQLWFLLEAHGSRVQAASHGGVADHSAEEVAVHTPVFHANGWLTHDEVSLVDSLYRRLFAGLRRPDVFIALTAPAEVLISRVAERGRRQDVPPSVEYLAAVSAQREQFLKNTDVPFVLVDSSEIDFRSEPGQQEVCELVLAALSHQACRPTR